MIDPKTKITTVARAPEAVTTSPTSESPCEGTPNAPKEEPIAPKEDSSSPTAPKEDSSSSDGKKIHRIRFVNNCAAKGQRFTVCVNVQPGRKAVMRLGPGSSARLVQAVSVPLPTNEKADEAPVTKWAHEVSILQELGFKKPRTCMVYLKKTNGNVGKAAEMMFLQRRKNEKKAKEAKKAKEEKKAKKCDAAAEGEDNFKFGEEQAKLEEQGFTCKRATRNLLNRFDGDIEKVKAVLEKRRQNREAKAKEAAAAAPVAEAPKDAEEAPKEKAAPKVTTFDEAALREQLMKRFKGDEEKVNKFMNNRKQQAQKKAKQAETKQAAQRAAREERMARKKEMIAARQEAKKQLRAQNQAKKAENQAKKAEMLAGKKVKMPQPLMMANPNHLPVM